MIGSYDNKLKLATVWDVENGNEPVGYGDKLVIMVINNVKNKVYWDDNLDKQQIDVGDVSKPPE
ncbi:MAG: hypothetical protein MJ217_02625 [Bacilli bacterium]|nr:hypothetical protein [Bacilli bacterium]